jgi:hypothetical protein
MTFFLLSANTDFLDYEQQAHLQTQAFGAAFFLLTFLAFFSAIILP